MAENIANQGFNLVAFQLTFSTVDTEQGIFFAAEGSPGSVPQIQIEQIRRDVDVEVPNADRSRPVVVVAGHSFAVEDASPVGSIPLGHDAGIFRVPR